MERVAELEYALVVVHLTGVHVVVPNLLFFEVGQGVDQRFCQGDHLRVREVLIGAQSALNDLRYTFARFFAP